MANHRQRVIVPTTAALPNAHRVPPTHPHVAKAINRVSREALIELVLDWLSDENQALCAPLLLEDEHDEELDYGGYPPCSTLKELRRLYVDFRTRKGAKREVADRVLEGDWRHGISLFQLAQTDMRYFLDHPTSQRWTAMKLASERPIADETNSDSKRTEAPDLPRFHAPTFLQNLQHEIAPVVKAHYYLTRTPALRVAFLRIYILDSPYNTPSIFSGNDKSGPEQPKTLYLAFPDGAPYVYLALGSPGGEGRSLRKYVIDALPKALSRPQSRLCLQPTSLHSKSLATLLALRGSGPSNGATGGWSIFADGTVDVTPLELRPAELRKRTTRDEEDRESGDDAEGGAEARANAASGRHDDNSNDNEGWTKRRRALAEGRFGSYGVESDGQPMESFTVTLEEAFPPPQAQSRLNEAIDSSIQDVNGPPPTKRRRGRPRKTGTPEGTTSARLPRTHGGQNEEDGDQWTPRVRVVFHGSHVFAGIRHLCEMGVVDVARMPGWMTGEAGVSVGVVRHGRMRGLYE
ncbi:MAG: hypothetical protein M1838_004430 [Thelocarpon superellum]|nr:MAG: hypothetical protein M1838_004430 [Thelocarpon superellum]